MKDRRGEDINVGDLVYVRLYNNHSVCTGTVILCDTRYVYVRAPDVWPDRNGGMLPENLIVYESAIDIGL